MAEKTVEEIIQANILMSIVMYTFMSMSWKDLSDEMVIENTRAFELQQTRLLLKSLDKAGFTIVKKEPALENYPSIT